MSSPESALLGKLKDAQAQYALESLKNPGERREYDYGFRCGKVAGIEAAIQVLLAQVKEERDGDRDL